MCGIAGIITENALNYKTEIKKMTDVLCHRGPDDTGSSFFNNCALGHKRLSIIDIDSGQQPMKSPVSDSYVVFNGEIYGYKEIKKQFADYPFKTKSDTEVLIALYDKYGNDMTAKLPGMFSFAIWNEKKQQLFCARDRFGEKPFYYAFGDKGEFIFASEIKAIICTGLIRPILDYNALGYYLRFKYINPKKCIYKNIYVLPPASCLTYKNGDFKGCQETR